MGVGRGGVTWELKAAAFVYTALISGLQSVNICRDDCYGGDREGDWRDIVHRPPGP